MKPLVSIIIRTMNEWDHLLELLIAIKSQDYDGEKEIIVVDNGSFDATPEFARLNGARVVTIKKEEFTFPLSLISTGRVIFSPKCAALSKLKEWAWACLELKCCSS